MAFQHTFSAFTNYTNPSGILGAAVSPNLGSSQGDIEDGSDATFVAHEGGHAGEGFADGEVSMKVADAGQPPLNAVITSVVIRLRHQAGALGASDLNGIIYDGANEQHQLYSNPGAVNTEDKTFNTAPDGSAWTRAKLFATTFGIRIGGGASGDNAHFVMRAQVLVNYESPAGMRLVALLGLSAIAAASSSMLQAGV